MGIGHAVLVALLSLARHTNEGWRFSVGLWTYGERKMEGTLTARHLFVEIGIYLVIGGVVCSALYGAPQLVAAVYDEIVPSGIDLRTD